MGTAPPVAASLYPDWGVCAGLFRASKMTFL